MGHRATVRPLQESWPAWACQPDAVQLGPAAVSGTDRRLETPCSFYSVSTQYLQSIYTVSTEYLHSIYTVSTQYLHSIYRVSTEYLHSIYTVSTEYLASVCTVASVKVTVVGWAGVGTSALHRWQPLPPQHF